MKTALRILFLMLATVMIRAQVPTANFSLSPNPLCSGAPNFVQIIDLSTNNPTGWSYTITVPGPNPIITTVQNPTVGYNIPGIYTISLVSSNSTGSSARVVKTLTVLPSPNGQINPNNVSSCPNGSPVILTAQTTATSNTFNWSTAATTQTISVSPTVTTIYTCVISATNGCSIIRTATITIGQPTVAIAGIPVDICPGSPSTLVATGSGVQPFTYSWSTGVTTRSISTSQPGVYSVTVTNGSGCVSTQTYALGTSTTLVITVTSNSNVICAGQNAVLTASGASSYTWSNGGLNPNVAVGPTVNTTYTVTGISGTCTGSGTISLTVNNIPTVTATSAKNTICAGDSVGLSAAGATTYTWQPLNITGSQIVVKPPVSTNFIVSGNNPGCQTRTTSVLVTVNPLPSLIVNTSSLLVCPGEAVAIAVSGANTYTWNTGSNQAVLLLSPISTMVFTVSGTDNNKCTATVMFTQSVSACEGINTLNGIKATNIFPNPTTGSITFSSGQTCEVFIRDVSGRILLTETVIGENPLMLDLTGLRPGVYFVTSHPGNSTIKLIKTE
jgi:hypothetical protein